MRESVPLPIESRYASLALTPSTSRNCSASAPGTTPERQVSPPSVVTAKVPPTPLTQATFWLTAFTPIRRAVVPLACGVRVGPLLVACCAALMLLGLDGGES